MIFFFCLVVLACCFISYLSDFKTVVQTIYVLKQCNGLPDFQQAFSMVVLCLDSLFMQYTIIVELQALDEKSGGLHYVVDSLRKIC